MRINFAEKNISVGSWNLVSADLSAVEDKEVSVEVTLNAKDGKKISFHVIDVDEGHYVLNTPYRSSTLGNKYFAKYAKIVHSILQEAKRRKQSNKEVETKPEVKPEPKAEVKPEPETKGLQLDDKLQRLYDFVVKGEGSEDILKEDDIKVMFTQLASKLAEDREGEYQMVLDKFNEVFKPKRRCQAKTQSGTQCKNTVKGKDYCHIHSKQETATK